jgi:hypothetical protein
MHSHIQNLSPYAQDIHNFIQKSDKEIAKRILKDGKKKLSKYGAPFLSIFEFLAK